ncbi:MAG: ATP synthase F0 subunit C [Thermodesulfobacteriota bacterium]
MKKTIFAMGFAALTLLFVGTGVALAAEAEAGGTNWVKVAVMIGAGLGIGIAAHGTGQGMGNAISAACEGTARNPEASGKLTTTMLIGLALIESLCIYALVIALIMLFVV